MQKCEAFLFRLFLNFGCGVVCIEIWLIFAVGCFGKSINKRSFHALKVKSGFDASRLFN